MIDNRNDPNRPLSSDPYVNRPVATERAGMGWGIPLAVAAAVIIGGFLFYNTGDRSTQTASTNAPTTTQSTSAPNAQSTPSPQVGKTAPPPAKTQ